MRTAGLLSSAPRFSLDSLVRCLFRRVIGMWDLWVWEYLIVAYLFVVAILFIGLLVFVGVEVWRRR